MNAKWHRKTDQEIFATTYRTNDPESLDGLIEVVPSNHLDAQIEFSYDFTGKRTEGDGLITCTHCARPNHYRGFVMKLDSGARFLVGNVCGAKIYGAHFAQMENVFRGEEERQRLLIRYRNLVGRLPEWLSMVANLKTSPGLKVMAEYLDQIQDLFPDLYRACRNAAAAKNGNLELEEKVRDYAAEERRTARESDQSADQRTTTQKKKDRRAGKGEKKNNRIYTVNTLVVARLRGTQFLTKGHWASTAPATIHDSLLSIHHQLIGTSTAEFSNRELKTTLRKVAEVAKDLGSVLGAIEAFRLFFGLANLRDICDWANQTPDLPGKYALTRTVIRWTPAEEYLDEIVLTLPGSNEDSSISNLEAMVDQLKAA